MEREYIFNSRGHAGGRRASKFQVPDLSEFFRMPKRDWSMDLAPVQARVEQQQQQQLQPAVQSVQQPAVTGAGTGVFVIAVIGPNGEVSIVPQVSIPTVVAAPTGTSDIRQLEALRMVISKKLADTQASLDLTNSDLRGCEEGIKEKRDTLAATSATITEDETKKLTDEIEALERDVVAYRVSAEQKTATLSKLTKLEGDIGSLLHRPPPPPPPPAAPAVGLQDVVATATDGKLDVVAKLTGDRFTEASPMGDLFDSDMLLGTFSIGDTLPPSYGDWTDWVDFVDEIEKPGAVVVMPIINVKYDHMAAALLMPEYADALFLVETGFDGLHAREAYDEPLQISEYADQVWGDAPEVWADFYTHANVLHRRKSARISLLKESLPGIYTGASATVGGQLDVTGCVFDYALPPKIEGLGYPTVKLALLVANGVAGLVCKDCDVSLSRETVGDKVKLSGTPLGKATLIHCGVLNCGYPAYIGQITDEDKIKIYRLWKWATLMAGYLNTLKYAVEAGHKKVVLSLLGTGNTRAIKVEDSFSALVMSLRLLCQWRPNAVNDIKVFLIMDFNAKGYTSNPIDLQAGETTAQHDV